MNAMLETTTIPDAALQARLQAALAEQGSIVVLVVGAGAESDRAERRCRALADDSWRTGVQVVRVEDERSLSRAQRARWRVRRDRLTVVGPDRHVAMTLDRPDVVDLFVALSTFDA